MKRFLILIAISAFFLLLTLYPKPYPLNPTAFAQTSGCGTSTSPSRATGLVSTPSLGAGTKFYTSSEGRCIVDPATIFVPFKIPTYDDLKSIYYTQSKASKSIITSLPSTIADQTVYFVNGDLNISSSPTGGGTAIVFVEGNLTFTTPATQFVYGTLNTGLVFVVRGNVNILQSYTRIDGVILSSGIICTAYDGISCPASNITTSQLVINGSLISLDSTKTIKFKRSLSDNTIPAEKIIHQVKYLVILRSLFSETLQKWTEVTGDLILPSPPPFEFSLANGGDKTLAQGSQVSNNITATYASGTAKSVSFSVQGLPSGVTSSFSPVSCTPTCTSTLTLTASSNASIGTFIITVTAEAFGITKTTTFTLTISACGSAVIGPALTVDSAICI